MIERTACLIGHTKNVFSNQAVEMQLMDTLPRNTAMLFLYESEMAVLQGKMEDSREICHRQLLEENGGKLARRVSGGAAQYVADGVLSYSFILPKEDFSIPIQMEVLARSMNLLKIPIASGRNFSLGYGGRFYSSSAFYKNENAALHHGTIFCDADLGHMALYLTNGSAEKSVCLRHLQPGISISNVEEALFSSLGSVYQSHPVWLDERMLDQAALSELTTAFQRETWIQRCSDGKGFLVSEAFPWGRITIQLKEKRGLIDSVQIFTDAFETDWIAFLEQSLVGAPFLISSISGRWTQRMAGLQDPRLRQITTDLITLICGHIKQSNRRGENPSSSNGQKENDDA